MITRTIPVGDLELVELPSGLLDLALTETTAEYVTIKLSNRFQLWLGEWFADKRQGMPYRERVFTKGADLAELRSLFIRAARIPEIARMVSMRLTADRKTRKLSVSFEAVLIDGTILAVDGLSDGRFVLDVPALPE